MKEASRCSVQMQLLGGSDPELRYRSGLHCQVHMGVNKETVMHVLPIKVQVLLNLWPE